MPKRPTLVTAICIYEGLAGLFTLGGEVLSLYLFYAVTPGAHTLPINHLHSAVTLFSAILSLGIASSLWWMRGQAFFLSVLKVLLNLFATVSLFYVLFSSRLHGIDRIGNSPVAVLVFWLPRFTEAALLLVSIAITIYIYRVTIATPPPIIPSGSTDGYIP
ncbi:hypothetical protein [Granulicella paludicola]|uniref:hypothetical protein n=1 Tax=Granulicella paludicola TaxID=474951 RepID=UPI0021E00282|nr:hypothetical protein [Granulicella paludicola]